MPIDVTRIAGGAWEVDLEERGAAVVCETLEEARRVAYLYAARLRECELIIRDEEAHSIRRELIGGRSPSARGGLGRAEAEGRRSAGPAPPREDVEAQVREALYGRRSSHIEIRPRA